MKLSRRDRKALELAYEVLREGNDAECVEELGAWCDTPRVREMFSFAGVAWRLTQKAPNFDGKRLVPMGDAKLGRLVTARLALAVRALLRAGSGYLGPYTYTPEAIAYLALSHEEMVAAGPFHGTEVTRRITPLWQQTAR